MKGRATHSSILKNSVDCIVSPWGHKELDTTERLSLKIIIRIYMLVRRVSNDLERYKLSTTSPSPMPHCDISGMYLKIIQTR